MQVGETATLLVRAVGGGTVSDAAWTFGDGDTATGTTVRHAWSTAHLFTVTVEATVAGERVSDRRHVEVLAPSPDPPVADFTITPATVDVGSPVTVRDLTRPAPTSWEWTFDRARGSGTSRQQNPPPQVWDTPGTYAVTLRVERAGESDEVTHTNIYGHINGTCLIGGVPVGEMRIGGPGALIASGPGSGTVTNRGEGWIELGPYIPTGCPEGTDDIADLDGRLWSIVHNGQGLTTRSEDSVITG